MFNPNDKFEYSNTGYALLASIIEKASKMSFGTFLKNNIFDPLEMKNTFVYRSRFEPQNIENYALGYISDSLGNKTLPDSLGKEYYTYYLDGIVGDGMVNSTTEDLLKWDRALYTNKLVDSEDKKLIFAPTLTNDGKENPYGFGWAIINHDKYGKLVSHSGGWAGYVTYIERHVEHDKTVIILQNNHTPFIHTPISKVRKILYNESFDSGILPDEADLKKYAGVYSSNEFSLKITIFNEGNILMAQATGQAAFPLDAYENHTFRFDQARIILVFNPETKTMDFSQGDLKFLFTRE